MSEKNIKYLNFNQVVEQIKAVADYNVIDGQDKNEGFKLFKCFKKKLNT